MFNLFTKQKSDIALHDLLGGIGADSETQACVLGFAAELGGEMMASFARADRLSKAMEMGECFANKCEDPAAAKLYFCCAGAALAFAVYRERRISEQVFFDTFRDIAIWSRLCIRRTGKPGMQVLRWMENHLSLRLFRLGRLQFKPAALGFSFNCGRRRYRRGVLCLEVHIPEDGPLLPVECANAYGAALRFFRGMPALFTCDSWLMYPALQDLVGADSNICRFQREYTVVRADHDARQAEERVFGTVADPSAYPADTSLRRALKGWLAGGKRFGTAFGIMELDRL